MRRDWSLRIEHTFREGNRTTDFLASIGYGYPFRSHIFSILNYKLSYFSTARLLRHHRTSSAVKKNYNLPTFVTRFHPHSPTNFCFTYKECPSIRKRNY
ncbi:hypothetical protein LINPERHAP2_LOCUS6086 [Linum perenne]